jgi:hypothetical protein
LQVQIQSQLPQNSGDISHDGGRVNEADEDHIDAALDELQRALEGCNSDVSVSTSAAVVTNCNKRPCSDLVDVPQLADYLRYLKYVCFNMEMSHILSLAVVCSTKSGPVTKIWWSVSIHRNSLRHH